MKLLLKLSILSAVLLTTFNVSGAAIVIKEEVMVISIPPKFSLKTFLELTPGKYFQLTGRKLSLQQKISLKLTQWRLKKLAKKNRINDSIFFDVETSQFSIVGFILGLALGPLGVLIPYLIEGASSSTFKWSIIGGIIWLGVLLLVLLL